MDGREVGYWKICFDWGSYLIVPTTIFQGMVDMGCQKGQRRWPRSWEKFVEELARKPSVYAKLHSAIWYRGNHYQIVETNSMAKDTFDWGVGDTY